MDDAYEELQNVKQP